MTEIICIIIGAICVIAAVFAIILYRRRTMKIMSSLDKMIDKAIDGSFTEENIDETMLSSVEAKLARYLTSSELSAKNVAAEKEKIKELIQEHARHNGIQHFGLLRYIAYPPHRQRETREKT